MIYAESSDNPKARNGRAEGLMQIKTSLHLGDCSKALQQICRKRPYNPFDPCGNITCGVYILCRLKKGKIGPQGGYGTDIRPGKRFDKCMHLFKP